MQFYVRAYKEQMLDDYSFPCFILVTNTWDDYSYKTTFQLQYYEERDKRFVVGSVKIMDIKNEEKAGFTELDSSFQELKDNYCSLGTSIEYYQELIKLKGNVILGDLLDALNDAAYMPGIREKFENTRAFQTSLLREREAKSALLLGERIVKGLPIEPTLNFTFSTKLKSADFEHSVDFKFDRDSDLPKRIFAIVGKNGTGKTMFLSNLANALSYSRENQRIKIAAHETGVFDTTIGPPFGKVISVSYSFFDTFRRPKPSKRFSYIYCGIRNDDGDVDRKILQKRHLESLNQINKKNLGSTWVTQLSKFVDLKALGYDFDEWGLTGIRNIDELETAQVIELSSGHSMLVYTLTELIANISENSLVLFDEPENHLHPNAIANLINTINSLVIQFDSFAIISTHSPIVIQEVPASNVAVFERDNNTPITRPLDIESYGENLTVITKHIFETTEVRDGYKSYLIRLSKEKTFEEINALFENRLSLNAKIFLTSLYS